MAQLQLFVSVPTGHAKVGTEVALTKRPAKHYYNTISAEIIFCGLICLICLLKPLRKVIINLAQKSGRESAKFLFCLGL